MILLFGACVINTLFSQALHFCNNYKNVGNLHYRDTENFLIFEGDKACFNLTRIRFGFITNVIGKGSYKIKKDKIIIYTIPIELNTVTESYYNFSKNIYDKPYYYKFFVKEKKDNQWIPYANMRYIQMDGNINGGETNQNGECELFFSEMPKDSLIRISYFGYQSIDVKIENLDGGTFDIFLMRGAFSIIQNKKIYLKYKIDGEDILIKYYKEEDIPENWIRLYRLYKTPF
jgi:hypothetical protein